MANIESHVGYIRISHNLFLGSRSAIALLFDLRGAGSSVITDNTLENCVYDCITVANGNGVTANNLQISRNEFMATGAGAGPFINNFIHIQANSGGTGPYVTNVQINENTMVGQFTASGVATYMNISSGDNVSINDNTIQHMAGDTAYGILVNSEPTRVSIKNLRETGTSTHPKYFIGNTDTQIADVQGLPVASLPAAANGSCIFTPDGVTGSTFNAAIAGGGTGAFAGRLNGSWVNHC
ncbi:hypothetical protein [Methylobacterium brachiatum]